MPGTDQMLKFVGDVLGTPLFYVGGAIGALFIVLIILFRVFDILRDSLSES